MNPFKRTINNGFGDFKLSLPRTKLLLYLGLDQLAAADAPIGDDTEVGDDTIIRGMFLLPADADIRAATGWVSGVGNIFYDAAGDPVASLASEIAAWSSINQWNVLFHLVSADTESGQLAIYDPSTVSLATLTRAHKVLREGQNTSGVTHTTPFIDQIGANTRTLYGLQYLHLAGATDFTNASITGTETVTSQPAGTAAITVAAGKLTVGAGDLWSFALSNGSTYEFGTILTATTGIVFDTSGNGRHLSFTVADTSVVCLSGREKGSEYLDMYGWSAYENLFSNIPTSINVSVEYIGDGYYSAKKVNTNPYTALTISTEHSHKLALSTSYTFKVALRKLPSSPSANCEFGWNASGFNGHSAVKLSGPGTVSAGPGLITVSALSETDDTVIQITKDNFSLGFDIKYALKFYPSLSSSTVSESGVVFKNLQVCSGPVIRDYPGQGVVSLNYAIRPKSNRGYPSPIGSVVCIGDSLTAGYVPTLSARFPGSTIVSAGVGGEGSQKVLDRFYTDVILAGADHCILFVGANDILGGSRTASYIFDRINACVDIATSNGVNIVLSTLSPMGTNAAWTVGKQAELEGFNAIIIAYGQEHGIGVANIYEAFRADGTPNLTSQFDNGDGLHFNAAGSYEEALLFGDLLACTFSPGDVSILPLTNPGSAKLNITRISGTSDTMLVSTHTYSLADSAQMRDALGWIWGVDHWAYSDAGVPKVVTGATILSNGIGPNIWANANQVTILS